MGIIVRMGFCVMLGCCQKNKILDIVCNLRELRAWKYVVYVGSRAVTPLVVYFTFMLDFANESNSFLDIVLAERLLLGLYRILCRLLASN